jgi:hypothetical protein
MQQFHTDFNLSMLVIAPDCTNENFPKHLSPFYVSTKAIQFNSNQFNLIYFVPEIHVW